MKNHFLHEVHFGNYAIDSMSENVVLIHCLKDAEILFDSPIDAAEKINVEWAEISRWWFSSKVQEARLKFCTHYARENVSKIQSLKHIIHSAVQRSG